MAASFVLETFLTSSPRTSSALFSKRSANASQTDYRTVEDQELDADIMASTYGLPEMARMLGVHRQTIYYIVANEDFELIKVGRYKRATKESFEKWYHNQTRYQLAEDRQERS